MKLSSRAAQILCLGRFWRGTPHPTPRKGLSAPVVSRSGRLGRGRRRCGASGGRAGAERGPLGWRRLRWAGAGRVGPPGATGRAAFLMCHQHVEPDRAKRASERNPVTFEGLRSSAYVFRSAAGGPCGDPQIPEQVWRGRGPSAGSARSCGNIGVRDPGCGRGAGGSSLGRRGSVPPRRAERR